MDAEGSAPELLAASNDRAKNPALDFVVSFKAGGPIQAHLTNCIYSLNLLEQQA